MNIIKNIAFNKYYTLRSIIEALKTNHIKTVLFILRIIDKEERKSYTQS
jgi:hypothetical protein